MEWSRREVVGTGVAALGAVVASSTVGEAQAQKPAKPRTRPANEPFGYCLNTSTIRGNKLDIWLSSCAEARDWGIQRVVAEVISIGRR